jgi:hypothetical protein
VQILPVRQPHPRRGRLCLLCRRLQQMQASATMKAKSIEALNKEKGRIVHDFEGFNMICTFLISQTPYVYEGLQ